MTRHIADQPAIFEVVEDDDRVGYCCVRCGKRIAAGDTVFTMRPGTSGAVAMLCWDPCLKVVVENHDPTGIAEKHDRAEARVNRKLDAIRSKAIAKGARPLGVDA